MLGVYEYLCEGGRRPHRIELTVSYAMRPEAYWCREHNCAAPYTVSAPAVHSIESHLRGTTINGSGGEYLDENIADPVTGKPTVIKSLAHKKQMLKRYGMEEKGENRERQKALKRTVYSHGRG